MKTICDTFNICSADIKNWLTKQPEVKEESMTDRFLFELSERVPQIKYKQFTRTEEGRKTGADWEWWFVFSKNISFSARVQAKKLKSDKDNYAGIAYTSNGMLQIERLLDDSSKDGFASFYAFYSIDKNKTLCGGEKKNGGVFIGEANKLRDEFILKSRKTLLAKDILAFTNPISCFFCCPLAYEGKDLISGFKKHMKMYYPTYNDNSKKNNNNDELGFRETPNYILQLLSGDTFEGWEQEYSRQFRNTNSIIAVDLRDNEKNGR